MVYGVTMLEDFYVAYKGKLEHVRAVLKLKDCIVDSKRIIRPAYKNVFFLLYIKMLSVKIGETV